MTNRPIVLSDLDPTTLAAAFAHPALVTVTHLARPWTHNDEKRGHRMRDVVDTAEWRHAFAILARQAKAPRCGPSVVVVYRECRTATFPDVVASAGAAKAGIDGLRDAGIWPDDTPAWVVGVLFAAPWKSGRDALTLAVHPIWRDSRQKAAAVAGLPEKIGRVSESNVAERG